MDSGGADVCRIYHDVYKNELEEGKMKRNAGCAVMIILGMLLAGCGNHTAAESTEMPGRMILVHRRRIS